MFKDKEFWGAVWQFYLRASWICVPLYIIGIIFSILVEYYAV